MRGRDAVAPRPFEGAWRGSVAAESAGTGEASDDEVWRRAVAAWRKAQVVHLSPSRGGESEGRTWAREVARRRGLEGRLWDLLADADRRVVAYAIVALELMGSDRLADLPESVLTNRSNVALQFGSVRIGTDLGGYARGVRKRARGAKGGQGLF